MFEIRGKINTAVCFAKVIDNEAISQIMRMCNTEMTRGSRIRIMPDVHAGKGCTIGTTMTIIDKAVPNVVGSDIGCGMYTVRLGKVDIDFGKVDEACHIIPSGFSVWNKVMWQFDFSDLKCFKELTDINKLGLSLGTLGGGNHFIEIDEAEDGTKYLVIHSGSRTLGKQVAEHYQNLAIELNRNNEEVRIPDDLSYLWGPHLDDYLHDVAICQQFARMSREKMAEVILGHTGLEAQDAFHTVHNYIDTDEMILRKGAIAAHEGELVLIPINMRDGSILATGKGNPEWNYSAPHGAGRIMSRSEAKELIDLEDYKKAMEGIYTTSIKTSTIDESPMAYTSLGDIIDVVEESVEIIEVLKPIFNFKAS